MRENKIKNTILNIIRGFLIGATDVIPGVSGSTTALILRVYHRFIHALKGLTSNIIPFKPKEWDLRFLIPLFLGIGLAVISMSKVIPYAIDEHPNATFSFFFGLISMSALTLLPNAKTSKRVALSLLWGLLGFLIAFLLTGMTTIQTSHSYFFLFISGFFAITAMLLPGVSGSFVLLMLGQYKFVFESIHMVADRFWYLFALGIGILVGVKTTSTAIDFFLRKHKAKTMAFLIGLMLGALRLPYQRINNALSQGSSIWISGFFILIGVSVIFMLNKVSSWRKKEVK